MQAYGEMEVLLYTFVKFVANGVLRCDNLKSCSAAVSAAATTTTATANTTTTTATATTDADADAVDDDYDMGLVLEDEEEGGEDNQWRNRLLITLPAKTIQSVFKEVFSSSPHRKNAIANKAYNTEF
jgi:hypothetical protein